MLPSKDLISEVKLFCMSRSSSNVWLEISSLKVLEALNEELSIRDIYVIRKEK